MFIGCEAKNFDWLFNQTLFNDTYPRTILVQYPKILLSSFGEEDFKKSCRQKPNFCIFPFLKFCQNACKTNFTIILTNCDSLDLVNLLA